MRTEPLPLDALRSIAERGCTGEFICASQAVEVHVYLQRGRLAWATDSEHPFVFTRHLQKTAQIDPESFRDILDSCRREKRPLGETLVSWGVATWEEVRDALRHQIELALDVLHEGGPAQTLFLDRTEQFAKYETGLTFDLAELLGEHEGASPLPHGSAAVSSLAGDGSATLSHESRSASSSIPSGGERARRLLDAVDGMLWAELLEGTTVVEAAPDASTRRRFAPEIVERTLLDGAEVVALRAPEGTLAGALLPPSSSLWCRLTPEATVGLAISALAAFAGGTAASSDADVNVDRGSIWAVGGDTPITDALRDFLGRAPETVAALVTDVDNGGRSCGVGVALAPEYALDLVRHRAHVLVARLPFADDPRPEDADDVGFRFRTLLTRERSVWCFGAELGTSPRRLLWLLLHRRSSQGLGWAYLTSLGRQLMHLRGWRSA